MLNQRLYMLRPLIIIAVRGLLRRRLRVLDNHSQICSRVSGWLPRYTQRGKRAGQATDRGPVVPVAGGAPGCLTPFTLDHSA